MTDLICISHLRWDFVWQRPQHVLSRLGAHYRVFFVEEPVTVEAHRQPELDIRHEDHNVTVIRLLMPADHPHWVGHGDEETAAIYEQLLQQYLLEIHSDDRLFWLYTPMGSHFTQAIAHQGLIVDVMDELSAFKGASPALKAVDAAAAEQADLIFTGGLSLYNSRYQQHPHKTFLFSSGVDIAHFACAAQPENFTRPADMPSATQGTLTGYYGVIDERMDLSLIAEVARLRPHWQFVFIGPILKISVDELPYAPNLHYLGKKDYADLPAYLAHFDVALIPFALSEATLFLSPTKTLEYMAAQKPVVSTPIPDVVALYGSAIHIADTPDAFAQAIEDAATEPRNMRHSIRHELLEQNTWDAIVSQMLQQMQSQFRPVTPVKEILHASYA